jgi:hypothetical protein
MRRLAVLALVATLPAAAHMMSMSTGEVRLDGARADYELRMPLYELQHLKEPEKILFENIRMRGGGGEAKLVKHLCEASPAQDAYLCRAQYEFPGPVNELEVECTFAAVTVPNHVHLLRALREGVWDQAIFDFSYTRMKLTFLPPGQAAMALGQVWSGMVRAVSGWAQLLFLLALAMAARGRRELVAMTTSFLAAECASALYLGYGNWSPAPRFVEAAAALTVAYMAVEILLLPEAGHRWAVAGVLGVFHGFYFGLFMREGQMHPLPVLVGVTTVEVVLVALFAWGLSKVQRVARVGAGALLVVGLGWFVLRLRG